MMAARARFDPDSAYIVHQHAAALHYEPLPAATMAQLANLERNDSAGAQPDYLVRYREFR